MRLFSLRFKNRIMSQFKNKSLLNTKFFLSSRTVSVSLKEKWKKFGFYQDKIAVIYFYNSVSLIT